MRALLDRPAPTRLDVLALAVLTILLGPYLVFGPRATAPYLVGLAVFGGMAALRQRRRLPFAGAATAAVMAAFIGFAALSVGWTPAPQRAGHRLLDLVLMLGAPFVVLALIRAADADACDRLSRSARIAVVLGILALLVELAFDQPVYRLIRGIAAGEPIGDDKINRPAALFALLIWPLAFELHRHSRAIALAVPPGYVVVMVFAPSQSALLGSIAGLAVLALSRLTRRGAYGLLAAGLIVGFVGMPMLADGLHRAGWTEADWLPRTAQHRVEIWDFAAERAMERPLFGHGLAASAAIDNRDAVSGFDRPDATVIPLHPHNLFLQVWLELGLVGVVLVAAAGLLILGALRALTPLGQRYGLALFGAALAMQYVSYGAWQAWWMAGIALAGLWVVLTDRVSAGADASTAPSSNTEDPTDDAGRPAGQSSTSSSAPH